MVGVPKTGRFRTKPAGLIQTSRFRPKPAGFHRLGQKNGKMAFPTRFFGRFRPAALLTSNRFLKTVLKTLLSTTEVEYMAVTHASMETV